VPWDLMINKYNINIIIIDIDFFRIKGFTKIDYLQISRLMHHPDYYLKKLVKDFDGTLFKNIGD
jgi:hypothetical protein